MITYGSTTLTSYNTITKIEVYYYKSTSATDLAGGSWSTTKPTWENGKYIWQKIKTTYEGKLENGQFYSESDPVNITGQQGATGTAAYSYKLNASDSVIGKTKTGEYTIDKITFTATYKQGTGAVTAYTGRFKIETTADGTTWTTQYTSSGNESSKEFTIPENIISVRCSLYQSGGTSTLLDIVTIPVVKDGIDAVGLRDSIPYYLASDKQTGVTRLDQGWTRFKPELTTEKRYLWVYYVSRYSEGDTQPELIEIKNDIVSFENHGDESPVENCVIDIEPVQDLNGQSSPYPAGGGKNLLYVPTGRTYTENGVTWTLNQNGSITVSGTATEASTFRYVQQEVGEAFNGDYYFQCFPTISSNIFQGGVQVGGTWFSVYASAKTALTGISGKIQQMWFQVRAGQTLNTTLYPMIYKASETVTEWSPYSNICPISGWTGANIVRTGKNLFDKTKTVRGYINDANGALLNNSNPNVASDYIPVAPNQSYYIKSEQTRGSWGAWYDKDKNYISGITGYVATNSDSVKVKTAPSNAYYMRLTVVYALNGESFGNPDTFSVNYPSTNHDYHPYTGNIYSITFPTEAGTVYGGTLDVTNGTLTVNRAMVDLGTLTWINATDNRFYTTSLSSVIKKGTDGALWIQSSMFRTVSSLNIVYNSADAMWLSAQGNVSVSKIAGTTTELIAEITGQRLVYELATPITYTLTPQEITMLTGQNHIFSDTGQTAISYYDNQTSTDPYIDYSATSAFEVVQSVSDAVGTLQAPYKEVEWVESTGKQYIYTDWKPPIKTWGFEIDFLSRNATGTSAGAWNETTNVNGYGNIFGVRSASGVNNVQLSSYSNGLLRVGNSTNIATGFKTDHTRQTIKLHNNTLTKTDGTTATITRVDEDSSKNYCNMTIFALYSDALRQQGTGTINEPSSTRIYSLKFYDGDTLTVDLVGAIRKADNVTGLYDRVTKHFYPAPGMLYGSDVGDIITDDTITENLNKTDVKVTVINKNRSRMWEANVPFHKLEDGQKLTVTYSYGGIVGSVETSKLIGWNDTSSNNYVYLKLTYPNGDTTEWIPCYYSNTARLTTHYGAGTPITFTYHENLLQNATETAGGSAVVRGFFANASYYNNTSYTQYSNNVKAGANGIKYNTLIMQDGENTWSCFYSGAYKGANTGKPAYTGGFRLGKVLYSAGSGAQTSNSSLDTYYNYKEGVVTSTIYDAYPLDLRYSTNCATTLVAQRPVYLVGTVESDGLFHLDIGQWWTQTIPTYEDGKVYVYLGVAYSTYQLWLATENPAYVYYNNEFILYDKALTLQNIATLKDSLETQIDGKVETWCQKTNPALSWDATERPNHTGDLWYYTGESDNTYKNNTTYQYNGSTNTWAQYSANPDLFDKIDGKAAIYYGTTSSVTSAEEGDYLVDSTDGSSYRWDGSKWVKVTDYKTAIDNIEIGGRNLLIKKELGIYAGGNITYDTNKISATETGVSANGLTVNNQIPGWKISGLTGNVNIIVHGITNLPSKTVALYYTCWNGTTKTKAQASFSQQSVNSDGSFEYKATLEIPSESTHITLGFGQLSASTYELSSLKLEKGNKATDWTPAPEDTTASIKAYVDTLQFQVDHMAEIYYGTAVPTLSNTPASDWTTNDIKDIHIDDLYYNTSTGYCYRFMKSGSTYSWSRIKDSDITAAATAASNANTAAGNAQTTANNANTLAGQKRRIFVAQPTPPYEIGDLWVEGSNGDIKKCKTARATGSYTASDWELASKYTDDTVANTANTKIDNLKKVRLGWKVNYSSFTKAENGECYFHGYDSNNAPTDANGIVEWNGADLTITKGMWINPNTIAPYNIPILHVFRTNTSPYHADVWWDDTLRKWRGYMYASNQSPATVVDWTWNETNDCILATYISPSSEGAITSGQLFNPPKKFSEINDPSDLYNELTTINDAIISRGEQLVINGNGMMGSNYNFSSLTFDGSKSNGSPGSFTRPAETATYTILSDELFPVTPSNTYVLSFDLMSLNNLTKMYAFISFYDVDKKVITVDTHMYRPNTLTTLSQDLKNGDTVVHLTDASNWETTGSYNKGLIFWNYANSFGYQYPELTYSRNGWNSLFDLSNIDKTNNTITLNGAWNHGTFPAGTKLSQKNAGATYKYLGITGSIVPNTWTSYKGRIGDIDYSGNNMMGMFPPGTAYAKVGFLWNNNKANDQIWVTNISVKEDVTRGTGFYAITTAPTAYTTQVGNFTPAYRIALSTVKTQSRLEEIMVGDVIQQGYNTYPVGYVDTSYVYLGSANSIRGATGATGLNNAQVILYRRFASAPSGTNVAPTGDVTYTFSTGKATNNLNSWTQNIPSGSDPVYMIAASASSTSSTDTIPKTEWSAPVKILENGQDGGTGSAGADGYNQATIFLYQRKSGTAPSKPSSAVTYTFSSGALNSTPTGWSRTIPANNGNPCYVTTATAVAKTATYSIPANSWSDVVILSQDGEDGTSITITSTSVKYQKGTSGTTAPTGTWGTSIPTVGENEFLWTQTIVNYSDNSKTESYSVSRNAKNGTNGTSPTVSSTTVEYQQSTGGTTPPTGTWSTTAPTATAGQYMWTRTTVTYSDSKTAVSYSVSKNGTNGTSPTAYHLIVSHGAINKSQAGVYNPTTVTLTSKYQTGNGALNNYSGRFKIETTTDNNTWTQDSASSTANESSKTYTIPANIKAVRFSLYLAGGFTTLLDQQTVPVVTDGAKGDNGEDAYTIVLTNEAHTFPAGVSAALAGSATSNVMTYKGGVQVACFVGSTSSATSISTGTTGLTCTINDNNSKNVSLTFTATTSLTTRAGTVTIPITVDNKAFSKTFTWSLANQGIKGEDGISVTNVTSTNNTADGGTSVVTITLSNGTTKTFNVKNGSKGSQGDTGATAEWYYGTALTHISGSATLSPSSTSGAVVGSMYLNTKTSLVYKCTAVGTNNTWTYAGDLITGVIDNLQVGGKNLLLKEPRAFDPTIYNPYQLNLTEPLEANQPYTIQLWDVDVSNDKKTAHTLGVNVYYCGGSVTFGNWTGEQYFTDGHADHLTLTFTPTEANVTHSSVNNTTGAKYISLYNSVSNVDGSVKNLTIGKWQLEKGNIGTDWTLAPEDVENAIQNAQDKADEAWAATQPLAIKTYNDVTITNNNDPKGWLYFGTVKPTNYNTPWKIRYKVYASINGITDSYQQSEVMIEGAKDTYYTYRTYNMVSNTNYRPLYAYSLYTLKQAGVNNGYGHLIGIRFQSAYWPNSTYTNYKRTIKIEIIESTNCQITLANTMFLYTDASGTGSTNYNTRYTFDGTTQGYSGSGDRNETNHILNHFSGKTGVLGIWQTGLFMRDGNGTYQNICTNSAGAISRTVDTTKKPNPNGFEIGSQIYYSASSYNANSNITGSVYASYGAFDSRYSLNTTLTTNCLTPYQPIYLVGTIRTDGLFHLDTVWWTQTATDSSKVYILIGGCYDSTTSYCRINLYEQNNWFKYVDGKLVDYTNRLAELASTTATAYITDTTDNGIMVHPENDTTSGWSIAGAIELFKTGISYIKLWIDNNIPKIRIGKEDSKHVLIDNDSVDIVDDETVLASFGETARIGKENQGHIIIDNDSVDIKKDNNLLLATFGANGLATYVGSGESVFLITTQADTSTATQKTESAETVMPNATLVLSYPPTIGTTATFEITITSPSLNYTFTDTVHITEPEEGVIIEPGDHEAVSGESSIVIQRSYDFPRRRTYTITQIKKDDVIIDNADVTITANYTAKAAAMEYRPSYTLGTRASYEDTNVGVFSFAEGDQVIAKGYASHAEGQATIAVRDYSHAEGKNTTAVGYYSHAEGYETTANSAYTHAEGCRTIAGYPGAHAEGQETTASGSWSHAEGYATTASGNNSHAEGYTTTASGNNSHASGNCTIASSNNQFVIGKYNNEDVYNKYAFILGNGIANARSNALAITWDGDTEFALDTTASSGTIDADLYDAITALGWENDVTA